MHNTLLHVIFLAFLFAGCANPSAYREPITRFQQASTVVIEDARIEYSIANKRERDAAIDYLVAHREKITLSKLNDKEIRVLNENDLAVRMAALDTLIKHNRLLLTLASSDAPTRAKDAANSFDDAIVSLNSSLGKASSDTFKSRAEGFSTIAAEVTKLALEAKINESLDKAIISSEKDILTLIELLQDDIGALHERRRNVLSSARILATNEYNEELARTNPNPEKLQKAATAIKKVEDAWDNLPLLFSAGSGLESMAATHQELVDYAKSSKNPQDLAELVDATDSFVTRAKIIADAIKIIRENKE